MSEQELNSLDRFRKKSDRLVLEQHSHCEVPAGCGGVVLRWHNPRASMPMILSLYTPEPAECFLDGVLLSSARLDLLPGRHILAVQLKSVTRVLLMFAAVHDSPQARADSTSQSRNPPVKVLSIPDTTWKFTLDPPSDGWKTAEFDDTSWQTLVRVPTPQVEWNQHGAHQAHRCTEQGAACMGLPDAVQTSKVSVWIRKVFTLSLPE